ncbi:hypothetical protein HYDPIDRAFT_111656 [Hydnomerulius pinastri MD-312]|uniref:Uncharacterized protein n=1 Tax=Hydnomerulius pinastri MD-312 TaxID=994086 RepID=A0A0C9WFM2_9AGAM|nr:hypothetical protein HYDPIDRAFT_111656 [Hydnomerulius pinastri MD-312]
MASLWVLHCWHVPRLCISSTSRYRSCISQGWCKFVRSLRAAWALFTDHLECHSPDPPTHCRVHLGGGWSASAAPSTLTGMVLCVPLPE